MVLFVVGLYSVVRWESRVVIWRLTSIFRLYAGKQRDPHPPFGLCLAQASMATGVFPMFVLQFMTSE